MINKTSTFEFDVLHEPLVFFVDLQSFVSLPLLPSFVWPLDFAKFSVLSLYVATHISRSVQSPYCILSTNTQHNNNHQNILKISSQSTFSLVFEFSSLTFFLASLNSCCWRAISIRCSTFN